MVVSYLSPRKRFSKGRATLVACFVIVLVVGLTFFKIGIPSLVTSPVMRMGRFAHGARAGVAAVFDALVGGVHSKLYLATENRTLRERLSALENILASVERRTEEDRVLLAALGRGRSTDERVVGAVVAKPGVLPYDLLLIDVGRNLGVTPGTLVFAPGDAPIGVVAETTANAAKVRLFSSAGEAHDVLVGESALPVTLRGAGGGTFIAELPRDSGLVRGSRVYWPSSPARAMGVVDEIESETTDPFVTAHVRFLTPLFALRWVEVEIGLPDAVLNVHESMPSQVDD